MLHILSQRFAIDESGFCFLPDLQALVENGRTYSESLRIFMRHQAPVTAQVLIHAGTGGVGQAAVEVCSALGASITATAGSAQKRTFLRAAGVFAAVGSRDASFVDAIAVRGAVAYTYTHQYRYCQGTYALCF